MRKLHLRNLLPTLSTLAVWKKLYRRRFVSLTCSLCCVYTFKRLLDGLTKQRNFSGEIDSPNSQKNQVEMNRLTYNVHPLIPGRSGRCWFHSQAPHFQDREILKRLGGSVDDAFCEPAPVKGARYSSEAVICPCTAPPSSAFHRHFLEIGAADGQYLSNLLFFELQLGWAGICVEGSPSSFELLKRNRPLCINVNAVIGPSAKEHVFYTFDSPNSWEIGMSCMQGTQCGETDAEAQKYADENGLTLYKQYVPMRKLSEIFAENEMKNFGWIMVDVEGAEDIVLPTIDLQQITADYISYENNVEHGVARRYLVDGGYDLNFAIGPDLFYSKKV